MLSNTIKVCKHIKRPRRTSSSSSMPLGLRNASHVASRYMKRKIQIESGPKTPDRGSHRSHLDEPCSIHENPKHTARQCRVLKKLQPLDEPGAVSGPPRILDCPHNYLPELYGRRARDPRSRGLGRLCGCTTPGWRDRWTTHKARECQR
jgi:hypothetical protein